MRRSWQRRRGGLAVKVIACLAGASVLVQVGVPDPSLAAPAPRFPVTAAALGGTDAPPEQRSGSADDPPSAGSTDTTLSSLAGRPVVRPAQAVPDRAVLPTVRRRVPAAEKLTDVVVRETGRKPSGVAAIGAELRSQWSERERVYRNTDGTHTRRLYDAPVNVRAADGTWSPIDLGVAASRDGRLSPRQAQYRTSFATTANGRDLGVLNLDANHSIAFGLRDGTPADARVSGAEVTYPAARPGADLRLAATTNGLKEDIVLRSATAPTAYEFDLRLRGLIPALDRGTGEIKLSDRAGVVRAVIPAGWMADARGAVSRKVAYALVQSNSGWVLRVTADPGWLRAKGRAFPVTVDPSVEVVNDDLDDTYVTKGSSVNRSGEQWLDVGNDDGTTSASYLHFSGLTAKLANQYIVGASLVLHNVDSASCTPKPVDVFAVGRHWSGATMTTWPGAPLAQHLAQKSFAYGGTCSGSGVYVPFPLPPDLVTDWTHGTPFHGLSVRAANEADTSSFKRFSSANAGNSGVPYLDVRYSPQGAAYRVDEVTLPTAAHTGRIKARVTNRGSATWTAAGPHKFGFVVKQNGVVKQTSPKFSMTDNVAPNGTIALDVPMAPLTPGVYQVFLTMYDGAADYQSAYGVPYGEFGLKVENVPPSVNYEQPASGAAVDSIQPTLYAEGVDTDNWPASGLKYNFKICSDPAGSTGCATSDWTSATWTPPRGTLKWSQTYYWWVRAHDNVEAGPFAGPLALSTEVPQPQITAHLGGTPQGAPAPGLDPQVGNFGMTAKDASVATVGPDLTIERTYNSLDPRTDTAFGQGWASRLDTQLVQDSDGSDNVVVTLPSGRQVRFGRNTDLTFAPPQGQNLTLVFDKASGDYTLRDVTGTRWVFNLHGRLRTITDPAGLVEELVYDDAGPGGKPTAVHNLTSNRWLRLTWAGGHVTAVSTDPPAAGQPALRWTYSYDGHQLLQVCDPGAAPNCTRYDYQQGSHYRSVVLDDNPRGYWRFGESSSTGGAASATARKPGADSGTYSGVALSAQGAMAGTADTGAAFSPDSASRVVLPPKLTSPTMSLAVELWFRTTSGGVLMSYADQPFGTAAAQWAPLLYVGQDGHLRGGFWVPKPAGQRQILSNAPVNDGQWHHVVLSGAIDRQVLYLDGQAQLVEPGKPQIATVDGFIDHDKLQHLVVGAGSTKNWPSGNNGDYHFNGSIDEVALYQHPLGETAVKQHYSARAAVVQLTKITRPQDDRVAASLTYDDIADRVATLTDHDGRTWRLDKPSRDEAIRTVTLRGPYPDWTYQFDADHGGRLTARTHDGKKRTYGYNTEGFLAEQADELGHKATFTTDARGNVLSRTTCRQAGSPGSCQTSYSTYFLNPNNPLDPRNDRKLTDADPRSSGPADATYRTTYGYDTLGRQNSVTYPKTAAGGIPAETWTYSTGSEPADGGGLVPAGLLVEHLGKRAGQVTAYKYRSNGDLAEQVDPVKLRTRYEYDAIGRRTVKRSLSETGVEFSSETTTYTPRSEVDTVTGPPVRNAVTGVTTRLVTDHDYDANGNLVRTTQAGTPAARTTTYAYNAYDQLVVTTHPDTTIERKEYRDSGREIRTTDPRGTTWIEYYDSQSRLLRKVASGPGVDPQNPDATVLTLETHTYDAAGRLHSSRDAMGRETIRTYWDDDRLATVTRAGVLQEQLEYDPAGNVTKRTSAGGRVTTSAFDAAGYATATTLDPGLGTGGLGRVTAYTRATDGLPIRQTRTGAAQPGRSEITDYGYDAAGRLVRADVAPSAGDVLTLNYLRDERGLVTATTDRKRFTTTYEYDAASRLVAAVLPEVTTWTAGVQQTAVRPRTTFGYNAFGDLTDHKDANGAVTAAGYDSRSRRTSVRLPTYTPPGGSPIAATTTTEYDGVGNPIKSVDPLQRVTERTFDPHGRLLTETLPKVGDQPSTTRYGYDRNGELTSTADPNGIQRLSTYDGLGRKITDTTVERQPQVAYFTTGYKYDDAGNRTEVTTPAKGVTKTTYNKAGEPITVTDPTSRTTTTEYDMVGRPTAVTDPAGIVTRTGYDLLGNATLSMHLSGNPLTERRRIQHSYDPNGNLVKTTSAEGRIRSYAYDAANRLVRQEEQVADGKVIRTAFGYDAAGNHTRLTDGRQKVTDYTYNSWGLPESTIEPGAAQWTAGYDAAGQLVRNSLPGGVAITSEYDAQGRLVRQAGTGAEAATADKTFGYDPGGRLTSFGTPGGASTVAYDDRGNVASISGGSGQATYGYDDDSRPVTRTDATGTSSFSYDAAGRPTAVVDGLSGRTIDSVYDAGGRLAWTAERGLEQGVKRLRTYDALGRLGSDKVSELDPAGGPPRVIHGTEYGYDGDDNLTAKTTISNNQRSSNSYSYDGARRLTSWTAPGGAVTPYEWDDAGNRTRAGTKTFTYNDRNQLTSDGTATYTYTPRGTLASGGKQSTYDAFERLLSDGSASYSYDSLGRVASRNGSPFAYNSLGNNVVSDGTRLTSRDPSGQPLSDKAAGSTASAKLLYSDLRGDVTGRFRGLDSFGQRTFDAFGTVTSAAGEQPSLGYQGEWTEPATAAVNMHTRWYAPDRATFASRDTWTLPPTPSVAANRYTYADANPLVNVDPTGHSPGGVIGSMLCKLLGIGCYGNNGDDASSQPPPKPPKLPSHATGHGSGSFNGPGNGNGHGNGNGTGGGGSGGPGFGPPPPPPLWLQNLQSPPPRPNPGTTVPPRPNSAPVLNHDDIIVIDHSDDYANEANDVTDAGHVENANYEPTTSPDSNWTDEYLEELTDDEPDLGWPVVVVEGEPNPGGLPLCESCEIIITDDGAMLSDGHVVCEMPCWLPEPPPPPKPLIITELPDTQPAEKPKSEQPGCNQWVQWTIGGIVGLAAGAAAGPLAGGGFALGVEAGMIIACS
ncbi:DNRLRE domain-containing protein [Kribbella sp. CA-253562]|uniref:DNRLRE domain-containing protein n=1 Tax=Kribbella sp. CA-253562 TaxID=3239942 RepID=UPI003D8AFBC9